MWAKIIKIKITKDLNYFSLCALNLFNTRVSQFELNYWNKLTFPRHSNLLRCTCMYDNQRCFHWGVSLKLFETWMNDKVKSGMCLILNEINIIIAICSGKMNPNLIFVRAVQAEHGQTLLSSARQNYQIDTPRLRDVTKHILKIRAWLFFSRAQCVLNCRTER